MTEIKSPIRLLLGLSVINGWSFFRFCSRRRAFFPNFLCGVHPQPFPPTSFFLAIFFLGSASKPTLLLLTWLK
jgi:hypothetical protein